MRVDTRNRFEYAKALSTRIWIYLNPQFFLTGLKNFSVHTYCMQIEFACPHSYDGIRVYSSTQGPFAIKCIQRMRHKETRPARCAAKLFYCSADWTRFC